MFHLADKAYRVHSVPPVVRTVLAIPFLLWLASGAAISAVALIWVAMQVVS